jgi:protein-S-isoprenylcysteine O-methyltransferase Ste14
MTSPAGDRVQWRIIQAIMVALLVWGGYLAIGAVQAGGPRPALRGLVVLGCSLFFLAFWLLALAVRQRRLNRERQE